MAPSQKLVMAGALALPAPLDAQANTVPLRLRLGHVVGIAGEAAAQELRQDGSPPGPRMLQLLQHQHPCAPLTAPSAHCCCRHAVQQGSLLLMSLLEIFTHQIWRYHAMRQLGASCSAQKHRCCDD